NLWKNIRQKTIRPIVQQFLYKAIHGAFMIGDFWENIPNYEDRQWCPTCHTKEDMKHIMVDCEATPVRTIWNLASRYWPHEAHLWPTPDLGTILGCGSIAIPRDQRDENENENDNEKTNTKKGANRLLQILLSESAYLIWVTRCEQTIQLKEHSADETERRWLALINRRLINDKITATKIKRDPKTKNLVKLTWKDMIHPEPPPNWLNIREVLVG
ncbi:hypothetical protein EDB85DRAFT_1838339, partial [Lactarius pseudohatsudake]